MKYNHLFTCIALLLCLLVPCTAGTLPSPQVVCPTFVNEGSTLQCRCQPPDGFTSAAISWPGHSESFRLVKENISRHENGTQFTCLMEFKGQSSTAVYTLQVAYGPSHENTSISGPEHFVTDGSRSLTITCRATDTNPAPSYSWSGTPACVNYTQNSGTCVLTPSPDEDGQILNCLASLSAGNHFQTSSARFVLNLKYPPRDKPVKTSSKPAGQPLRAGDNLTCTVTGGKPPVSSVNFNCTNPDHADRPDVVVGTSVSSSFTIHTSQATAGDMECYCSSVWDPEPGLYQEMEQERFQIEYKVKVTNFTLNGTPNTVPENEIDIIFTCEAIGRPLPNITISLETDTVTQNVRTQDDNITRTMTYTIPRVTCDDMGEYTCKAVSSFPSDSSSSLQLNVNCTPRLKGIVSDKATAFGLNSDGYLTFNLIAFPVPNTFVYTYFGTDDDREELISSDNFTMNAKQVANSSVVQCTIKPHEVTKEYLGLYSVNVSNDLGGVLYYFRVEKEVSNANPLGQTSAAIAGGVVGGVVLVLVVFTTVVIIRRKDERYAKPLIRRDDTDLYAGLRPTESNNNNRQLSVNYANTEPRPDLSQTDDSGSYVNIVTSPNTYDHLQPVPDNHTYSGLHAAGDNYEIPEVQRDYNNVQQPG